MSFCCVFEVALFVFIVYNKYIMLNKTILKIKHNVVKLFVILTLCLLAIATSNINNNKEGKGLTAFATPFKI